MSTQQSTTAGRSRHARGAAFAVASGLTVLAAVLDNVTIASADYAWLVVGAIACASVAGTLIVALWKHATRTDRVVLVLLLAVDVWTLLDAAGRRLPALGA